MTTLHIIVENVCFSVDRSLAVKGSEYFRALFQSGMRECQQKEISLQGLTASSFNIMLRVLRGERPLLNCEEIVEAVECAAFLQVETLEQHLSNIINSTNCLVMCHSASVYGLLNLYHTSALFIRDMYLDLKESLECMPEDVVDYIESLSPSTFVAVVAHSPSLEFLQDFSRTICYLDEDEKTWKTLTELPVDVSTFLAGITVLDNKLYIVGGVYGASKKAVEYSFCYDVDSNTWSKFSNPQQLRYNLTLTGKEGYLYAIGGEYEKTVISSVEKYDISKGTWSFCSHLPQPAAGAACAQAMSRIFLCLWKPLDTTDIYEYKPRNDSWTLITTLIRQQSYGHCMVAHRDNLYVMRNGPSDDFLRCMIDCFNITTNNWTALAGQYVNSKGALFTASVKGDWVFTVNRMLTLVYSIEENKWKPKKEMKGYPRGGSIQTCFLRLPQRKKDQFIKSVTNDSQ
ncbi:kelch repeat and BTB domain-containing protein 13 [Erpetoichthys calabaricus]|uniref:kelch repeat and BTB domain-containing protein 13 n=1 Tax=Erpetoichthys calabaricus TaxID=27687 RepID=UPI00109FE8A8|nr:kelch repeat and BTB domain-containing protein 13 [Erpetoichthys calabaricus]